MKRVDETSKWKPYKGGNEKFENPLGHVNCDCGTTVYVYPDHLYPVKVEPAPLTKEDKREIEIIKKEDAEAEEKK